jgi:sugar/nucleoside kinase (ribokinase family)
MEIIATDKAGLAVEFVTFSLIIDDIVFPDGQTAMGTLGGGGPQTAFGMGLWADRVGLAAGVGADLPAFVADTLRQMGVDTTGLRRSDEWPTLRAWQVLEADGRRTQIWRVPDAAHSVQLSRGVAMLPPSYQAAKGYHLGVHPEDPELAFIYALQDRGATVSVEPFRPALSVLNDHQVRALVSAGQIFSPNVSEAKSLVGDGEPSELVDRLAEAGARIVALRQGEAGTLLYNAESSESVHISAVKTQVVDPTGAGNAFCGGFLVGWIQTGNLRTAGLYGTVAASFLVEQVGLPSSPAELKTQARIRLRMLQKQQV